MFWGLLVVLLPPAPGCLPVVNMWLNIVMMGSAQPALAFGELVEFDASRLGVLLLELGALLVELVLETLLLLGLDFSSTGAGEAGAGAEAGARACCSCGCG